MVDKLNNGFYKKTCLECRKSALDNVLKSTGLCFVHSFILAVPIEGNMRIWENKNCDTFCASGGNSSLPGIDRISELLDLEVSPAQKGLEVLRIGEKSPFCRLKPLGCATMQGLVERNDRIIAINGLLLRSEKDLQSLVDQGKSCEVTIFDHRTRLTVSWQIQVREMLESA